MRVCQAGLGDYYNGEGLAGPLQPRCGGPPPWAKLLQSFRGLSPPRKIKISVIFNRKPTQKKFQQRNSTQNYITFYNTVHYLTNS